MNPGDSDPFASGLHRALRSLPNRRAPGALADRVLVEIARKEALPWWRRSQAGWPAAARISFIAAAAVLIAVLAWGAAAVTPAGSLLQFVQALSGRVAWVSEFRSVFSALSGAAAALTDSISPLWLFGGLAVVALWCAAAVGVGAAFYRMLLHGSRAAPHS